GRGFQPAFVSCSTENKVVCGSVVTSIPVRATGQSKQHRFTASLAIRRRVFSSHIFPETEATYIPRPMKYGRTCLGESPLSVVFLDQFGRCSFQCAHGAAQGGVEQSEFHDAGRL